MIDDLFDYVCEMDGITLIDLITRSEDIITSFVEEFDYDCSEVRQYYYNYIIPKAKRNIVESKLDELEDDFKV